MTALIAVIRPESNAMNKDTAGDPIKQTESGIELGVKLGTVLQFFFILAFRKFVLWRFLGNQCIKISDAVYFDVKPVNAVVLQGCVLTLYHFILITSCDQAIFIAMRISVLLILYSPTLDFLEICH